MMPPMRRPLVLVSLFAFSIGAADRAFAQPAPAPEATPAPADQAAPAAQLPPAPEVKDPMLQPVPPAAVQIGSWDDALKHVRARSTDLRIAAEEVARAEAQSRVALAGALPSLNGQASFTHNLITNETVQVVRGAGPSGIGTQSVKTPYPDYLTASLTAVQPVLALRSWYAIGTADRNEDLARLSLEDTKRIIALDVANAIVGVVTAERISELNRVGLQNALTRLELTTRKTALGSGTGLDVIRGRQDVETARATLVTGDEALRQAREALGLALGLPEQVGVPPNVDLNGLEASARASCKASSSIDERPDVAALHGRVELSHRMVNDVKYQFAPTIDVRSSVNTSTIDSGAAPSTTWNVQAVLTVPIWEGGVRYGNLRDTKAQELIAVQQLEAGRRQATVQVEQARRAVGVAEERRRVATQARDLAAENDRLTRAAYLEGRGTSLELVTAAQVLREAEIQLALREFDLVKARVLAVIALASCPW